MNNLLNPRHNKIHLFKANIIGVLAETLSTHIKAVLANHAMPVGADSTKNKADKHWKIAKLWNLSFTSCKKKNVIKEKLYLKKIRS